MIKREHVNLFSVICIRKNSDELINESVLKNLSDFGALRAVKISTSIVCIFRSRISRTISAKRSRSTTLHSVFIKVWACKWAIFFVDTDECWCSSKIFGIYPVARYRRGSRSAGRSVAVVLFKKLNIETRVNTGHPFPRGGKRMRLYECNWKLLCVETLSRRIGERLLSTVVS